ncbi:substrate-binding domain-containing protein [Brevibacillus fluminis]|uniref:substrate-binding domain-containing protein n=1 Tax=Brevibacillus fluminis TaxID=511487 RepID=UPI003F8AE690
MSVFGVLLALMAQLSACTATDQENRHDRIETIALIVKMKHGDFWRTVKMGAESAAKELDVNLNFYAPDYEEDVEGQIRLIDQAFRDGADAVVVAANDAASLAEVVKEAKRTRIPLISIDSEFSTDQVKSFIGTDNLDAGKKAADKLMQLVGNHGKIAMMGSITGADNTEQREIGLRQVLSHYPQVQLVAEAYSRADPKLAAELVRKLLTGSEKIDGILALNATVAIAIAEEINKLGLTGKIKLVTIDSPPEVLEYLQDGAIQATIIQKPFSIGYLSVKHAVEAIDGIPIPGRVDTGTKVIDLENMFWSENQKLLFPFVK